MEAQQSRRIKQDLLNIPNALTMGRVLVIPLVCYLVSANTQLTAMWGAILFGLAAVTDWLDGYLARKLKLVSMTGKFLDPLADKLLVMALLCTFLTQGRVPLWFVIVALAREMSITGLRSLAAGEGMIIAAGWGGKWKTAFQLIGLSCMIVHHEYFINFGITAFTIRFDRLGYTLMMLSLVWSLWSAGEYFWNFLANLDTEEETSA